MIFSFVSCLHYDWIISYLIIWRYTSCWWNTHKQTLLMRCPFQSTSRPISHRNLRSFRVYVIPLWDFVPEWNSHPSTTIGVNSCQGDSCWHDILWWYHVNKCRAMKRNRSELTLERKWSWCHVNTPLHCRLILKLYGSWPLTITSPANSIIIVEKSNLDCVQTYFWHSVGNSFQSASDKIVVIILVN